MNGAAERVRFAYARYVANKRKQRGLLRAESNELHELVQPCPAEPLRYSMLSIIDAVFLSVLPLIASLKGG